MGHFLILVYLVTLLAGAWAAFATRQAAMQHRASFLSSLVNYIVLFNVAIFFYLIINYVSTNLLAEDVSAAHPIVLVVLCLAGFCVEIGVAFSLVQAAAAITERPVSMVAMRGFQATIGLLGGSFVVGVTLAMRIGDVHWLLVSYAATATAATVVIVACLIALTLGSRPELDPGRQRATRYLGALFLSGWLAYVAGTSVPEPVGPALSSAALLWLNIVPLVWLRSGLALLQVEQQLPTYASALDAIAAKHRVTAREREVVELIIQGKSNKEVQALLFISSNTVKNHIYNIYRKLGVKSRTQLMSLVMVTREGTDADEPVHRPR